MEKKSIMVKNLVQQFSLEVLAGQEQLNRKITRPQTHRPGLEFIGYFDFFPMNRVQVLGQKEINFLHQLSHQERRSRIGNIVKYHPPCFIVTTQQEGLQYLKKYCTEENIPLLRTPDRTTDFIGKVDTYMMRALAEETVIHGVCINVFGMGILLRGKSGIGKSETAHTLIGRGHRLVADDIIVLKRLGPETIIGTNNGINKELLALRSVGLINVVMVYGTKAFKNDTRIALDIELTTWEENSLHNELEVEKKYVEYLGVQVPHLQIQLQPGRDIAGLIEAAATSRNLEDQGYSAVDEFMRRVDEELQEPES